MRNGIFTYYNGFHLNVNTIRDDDENVLLSFKGENNPFENFEKSKFEENTFEFIIKKENLKNAYNVITYCFYKGYVLKVFSVPNTPNYKVWIATSDKNVYSALNLKQINIDWYMKEINIDELSEIWEERSPALGLPMPEGLKEKEFITPYAG